MILDNLKNARLYYGINDNIKAGLKYLESLKPEVELGEYQINENVKSIVSEYETKETFTRGYEAHKKVIDVQFPIVGRERIKWSNLAGMEMHIDYDPDKDRAFYKNPSGDTHVDIGNGFFAIFFPEDAHGPQYYIDKPELIKKVTLKVKAY
ncbi:MAG: YhcH/YjgK/YiaL family protein [Ignavibacteriales bacterium]|nr:YhcH/YjgK/YiaL family protein [Ignavibacteriales bacterium]